MLGAETKAPKSQWLNKIKVYFLFMSWPTQIRKLCLVVFLPLLGFSLVPCYDATILNTRSWLFNTRSWQKERDRARGKEGGEGGRKRERERRREGERFRGFYITFAYTPVART